MPEILDRLADPEAGSGSTAPRCSSSSTRPDPWQGQPAGPALERGHPLPGDLPRRWPMRTSRPSSRRMVAQLDTVMTELDVASAQERLEPHALRGADRGVAHRGGDEGRRGAAQGRPGHLQPAQPGDPARASTPRLATRPSWPGATARTSTSRATRPTTPGGSRACRRRRSRRRAGRASRPRSTPPTGRGSTTSSRMPTATTSSPTATASSSRRRTGAVRPGWAAGSRADRVTPGRPA